MSRYAGAYRCIPSVRDLTAYVAGACATVLKAFFDDAFPVYEPVIAREDGLSLEPYTGPTLTVWR